MTKDIIFVILSATNILISLFLSLVALFKAKKNKANQYLIFFLFNLTIYACHFIVMPFADTKEKMILLISSMHIFVLFITLFFYHFTLHFLNSYDKHKKILITGYSLAILFIPFLFTKFFIKDIVYYDYLEFYRVPGILFHIFLAFFFLYYIISLSLLVIHHKKESGIKKEQIKYIIFGSLIGVLVGSSIYLKWYGINVPPYNGLGIYIMAITTLYAIVAHRLMDIKLVLKKSSVYIASFVTVLLVVSPIEMFLNTENEKLYTLFYIISILIALLIFPIVKKFYFKLANKYFFTSSFDVSKVISNLNTQVESTLDIQTICEYISRTLINDLKVKAVAFLSYNKAKDLYQLTYNKNFKLGKIKEFKNDKFLSLAYSKKDKIIIVDELKIHDTNQFKETYAMLIKFNISILIPLKIHGKTIGLITLSEKESGDIFNSDDLALLELISSLAATNMKNAELYSDIKEKNTYLQELVDIKGDFLRIINHQLNTPLSIMRMGLSAYREKTIDAEESLNYISSGLERMSNTLNYFWDAYNLEGKRKDSYPKNVSIKPLIVKIIEQKKKSKIIRNKNIEFKFVESKNKLKDVFCDPDQITHALNMIIDNSLHYTKDGIITISFKEISINNKDYLKIFVRDTGIGIAEEYRKEIFNKFFRGKNAVLMYPDGSGLGLYIASKIIKNNNGILKLEKNIDDVGSLFSVSLPIA